MKSESTLWLDYCALAREYQRCPTIEKMIRMLNLHAKWREVFLHG